MSGTEVFVTETLDDVVNLVELMLQQEIVAFDTETTANGRGKALDYRYHQCLCISFTFNEGESWIVPFRNQLAADVDGKLKIDKKTGEYDDNDLPWYWDDDEIDVIAQLQRFFSSDVKKVAHNGKFDLGVLHKIGIFLNNYSDDTLLMHALIDESAEHKLETLRPDYTDVPFYEGWKEEILPSKDFPYAIVPVDTLHQYAGADTDVTLKSYNSLVPLLEAEGPAMVDIYHNISIPLARSLFKIERTGVLVDIPRMMHVQAQYQSWIKEAEEQLFEAVGRRIPYASNDAKAAFLYGELGLPVIKKTKKGGKPSTDADTINELMNQTENKTLGLFLRLSKLLKQRNTYLAGDDGKSGLARWLDDEGRIHTNYNQTPRTGRLSSNSPNLQNITKNDAAFDLIQDDDEVTAEDLIIRTIFCAPPGYYMVEQDYSQLELRIQERVTRDTVLTVAFANGGDADMHTITASGLYGVPLDQVTKDQRAIGKRANFAQGYGGGKAAVQRATKFPLDECQRIVDKYRETYAGTIRYQQKVARLMEKQGFVENIFGRRRHFPRYADFKKFSKQNNNPSRQFFWTEAAHMERQGYNHLIQSPGSDFLSLDTIDLVEYQPKELTEMGALCCLTLHDALYWYVPCDCIESFLDITCDVMENAAKIRGLNWTLPVDSEWGPAWGIPVGKRKGNR